MTKRIVSLALLCALCLCVFGGCSSEKSVATGIAYLTKDGKLMLLNDLSGDGEPVRVADNMSNKSLVSTLSNPPQAHTAMPIA